MRGEPLVKLVEFSGEESSRFTRFAQASLACGIEPQVYIEGQEPLTSRPVQLQGVVTGAVFEGYIRYIIVREDGSNIEYWAAGRNATRSIACRLVRFELSAPQFSAIVQYGVQRGEYIPNALSEIEPEDSTWRRLDSAPKNINKENLNFLLECLSSPDVQVAREAAFSLRTFASFITRRSALLADIEARLLASIETIQDLQTRIALTGDLGYIGTSDSVPKLTEILLDETQDPQWRWAATTALGRISDERVVNVLIQAVPTMRGWSAAAALLGLSRWASTDNQEYLEPVFVNYLVTLSEHDSILARYACLGLSRFDILATDTVERLLVLLGDSSVFISVRGFAALALSTYLPHSNEDTCNRIQHLVDSLAGTLANIAFDPETVWGLEFLAELAALMERNLAAAKFYHALAGAFEDWRAEYYEAMSWYERGESLTMQGDGEEALRAFHQATTMLQGIHPTSAEEDATITFRLDIFRARMGLHEVILNWLQTVDASGLEALSQSLEDIMSVYARYTRPQREPVGLKQLSIRESNYIRDTNRLLVAMNLILKLDASVRSGHSSLDNLAGSIANLKESVTELQIQFNERFTQAFSKLISQLLKTITNLQDTIARPHVPAPIQHTLIRSSISELRGLFSKTTWPMPARARPISGLGRGKISVIKENLSGNGTETNPFVFPPGTPPVFNVHAEINEMAPGATTRANVSCHIGNNSFDIPIHAVEGPVGCTVVLPDVISPATSTKVTLQLRFQTRDCYQVAASIDVYARRGSRK